jgi:predicted PurR-regulated permease PerM
VENTSGILWALQVIVGPIILGIALAYATFRYRRRRRLGETHSTREVVMLAVPVIIAVAFVTFLLMIPGSQ